MEERRFTTNRRPAGQFLPMAPPFPSRPESKAIQIMNGLSQSTTPHCFIGLAMFQKYAIRFVEACWFWWALSMLNLCDSPHRHFLWFMLHNLPFKNYNSAPRKPRFCNMHNLYKLNRLKYARSVFASQGALLGNEATVLPPGGWNFTTLTSGFWRFCSRFSSYSCFPPPHPSLALRVYCDLSSLQLRQTLGLLACNSLVPFRILFLKNWSHISYSPVFSYSGWI